MRVLLIGPYDASGKRIRESIREALSDTEVQIVTPDSLLWQSPGGEMPTAMADAIESADLIIADMSQRNPNVIYELGLAHGLRKPTIVLDNSHTAQPMLSDLAHTFFLSYDPDNLPALNNDVKHRVMSYAGRKTRRK